MITFTVSVEDQVSPMLRELVSALSGSARTGLNEVAGRSATNAAKDYHLEFQSANGWRGPRWFAGTGPKPAEAFDGGVVANAWRFADADPEGATIANNAPHYRHKVDGGTITPKRVGWLTIPLIPDAKYRRARDYEIFSRHRLFRPRGKDVLMEKTDSGGVRSVYALVRSVTQQPWPGALPPDDIISTAFATGWLAALDDYLDE